MILAHVGFWGDISAMSDNFGILGFLACSRRHETELGRGHKIFRERKSIGIDRAGLMLCLNCRCPTRKEGNVATAP